MMQSGQKVQICARGELSIIGSEAICKEDGVCGKDGIFCRSCQNVAAEILDSCRDTAYGVT